MSRPGVRYLSMSVIQSCLRAGGGISRGVAQSRTAVYLEKEEAVEEPFGRFAVGGDVVGKLPGIPFDCAVFAAVVYKDKVADGCATDL